jgi:single-stranded-DNA-specific exonuclease
MTYLWNHLEYIESEAKTLREALGIDPALVKRLLSLNIRNIEEAQTFFRPELDQLHKPLDLLNMGKAVERLLQAIENEELILIYGDYDADGICGVALVYRFFARLCKRKPIYYIPDRIHEGYGVTSEGIAFGKSQGASVAIIIDLGPNQKERIAEATEAGMDVIICDHHPITNEAAEPYALINPMQPTCPYPNKHLSGCAVAFQLARAIASRKNIPDSKVMQLIDLVAISLATDILPLLGENRILAGLGIAQLSNTEHVGMLALLNKLSKQRPYSISDIVYGIGPLINAPGRMSQATEAVKMLTCTEPKEAAILAQRLASLNVQRRHFDEKQSKQAQVLVQEITLEPRTPVVLYKEDWSAGVIGITAGRLADQLHRPVIIFARHTDRQYIGSARSISGIDLAEVLGGCAHLVDEWGGHAHAAGLKIRASRFEAFRDAFYAQVQAIWPEEHLNPILDIVDELPFDRITPKFIRVLGQFAPFGPKNRSPVFHAKSIVKQGELEGVSGRHLKFRLACTETGVVLPALVFHHLDAFKALPSDLPISIAFTIHDQSFQKGSGVMLQLKSWQ